MELYDKIGRSYTATRCEDPRIAARIHAALGGALTVVNVGAGTGSYEPPGCVVTAIEPSATMNAQRPSARPARVIEAYAEALPLADGEVDAALAVLSDHHWRDRAAGLRELRRVARGPVVVFTYDPSYSSSFWMTRDYLPGFKRLPGLTIEQLAEFIGATRVDPVPIPHDCQDGFYHAFWRRPEAYLRADVQAGISVFGRLSSDEVAGAVERLADDLDSGVWHERNRALLDEEEHDWGYRLLVAGPRL